MKKFLSMLAFTAFVSTSFLACSDDETTPDGPSITAPSITTVQIETAGDVTFPIIIPGGFKSYEVTATGGTAQKKSEPATGATSGDVIVTYTADATTGAGSVTIVVTDNNNKIQTQTAAINKTTEAVAEVVVVSGVLEGEHNWTANKIYELAGRVIVKDGGVLNIEAGTVIKGRTGTGINASVLMVARGGKINALGTAENPITMTSVLDDVQPGQTTGTTLTEDDRGKWGGLVILGKAPISVSGANEAQIEGVPASETLGLYGGADASDNSGTIQYVSIRHGGSVISEGSEINGLTLGGVGSATTINNIEVFANEDDGVELFGGSVNVSNIIVAYQGDDGIDIDQAYSGTIDGFYVIHGGVTDEGLEIDGPEGTNNATGKFTLKNGTLRGDPTKAGDVASLADFKSKAQGTVQNVLFIGYPAGKKLKIAASFDETNCTGKTNAYTNLVADNLVFTTIDYTNYSISVYNSAATAANAGCAIPAADQTAAEGKIVLGTTSSLPAVATWSWTVSEERSLLQ
jgi:hypothetical protein